MYHYKVIVNMQFVKLRLSFIFKGVPTSKRKLYSLGGRSLVFHLKKRVNNHNMNILCVRKWSLDL